MLACAFAATPAALRAQTPGPVLEPLAAVAIFDRARAAANNRTFPAFYSYRVDSRIERKGKIQEEHYLVTLRHEDGRSYVEAIRQSATDRVDMTPHVRPSPPFLGPARTFGLSTNPVRTGTSIFEEAASPEPRPLSTPTSEAHVIGRIRSVAHEYDIELRGEEMLYGRAVYHLALTPRFAPEKKLLRELYVDRDSFQTWREVIQVAAGAGPIRARPLATIDYQQFGSGTLIRTAGAHVELKLVMFAISADVSLHISDPEIVEHPPEALINAK